MENEVTSNRIQSKNTTIDQIEPDLDKENASFLNLSTKSVAGVPKIPPSSAQPKTTNQAEESTTQRKAQVISTELTLAQKETLEKQLSDYYTKVIISLLEKTQIDPENISTALLTRIIQKDYSNGGFFKILSVRITELIQEIKANNLNITKVLRKIYINIGNVSGLSDQIKSMVLMYLDTVHLFETTKTKLSDYFGLSKENYTKYLEDIHRIFIEGCEHFYNIDDYEANIDDQGAYVFENEILYITRILEAFACAIKALFINDNLVTLKFIDYLAGICASYHSVDLVSYGIKIKNDDTAIDRFIHLLQQGKIEGRLIFTDETQIPETLCIPKKDIILSEHPRYNKPEYKVYPTKTLLENYINLKLAGRAVIEVRDTIPTSENYIVDSLKVKINDKFVDVLVQSDGAEKPFLMVFTGKPMCYIHCEISFDTSFETSKQTYAENLIANFNEEILKEQNDLEYITSVVKLCAELHRTHLYRDANGRITFFILLPVLLLKKGLWLKTQEFDLWTDLDTLPYKQLAQKIKDKCIPAPEIKPDTEQYWLYSLPINEQLRVACITGDKIVIDKLLGEVSNELPKLFISPIINLAGSEITLEGIKNKNPQMPLDLMKQYGHMELHQYTSMKLKKLR